MALHRVVVSTSSTTGVRPTTGVRSTTGAGSTTGCLRQAFFFSNAIRSIRFSKDSSNSAAE